MSHSLNLVRSDLLALLSRWVLAFPILCDYIRAERNFLSVPRYLVSFPLLSILATRVQLRSSLVIGPVPSAII